MGSDSKDVQIFLFIFGERYKKENYSLYAAKNVTITHHPPPEITAENILNRNFHADKPNEKWLTDVTEFKWYRGPEIHKLYLSAILDLYDRRIVAYKIGTSNNNKLVFDTF